MRDVIIGVNLAPRQKELAIRAPAQTPHSLGAHIAVQRQQTLYIPIPIVLLVHLTVQRLNFRFRAQLAVLPTPVLIYDVPATDHCFGELLFYQK